MKKLLFLLFFTIFTSFTFVHFVNAQNSTCENPSSLDLDQIGKCLDDLSQAKSQSEKATKPLEDQVNAISARVNFIEKDLVVKERNINESYKNLEKQQQILYATIRDYYIKSYYNSPLLLLLSSNSVSELTQTLEYQKVATDRDKAIITNIVISITNLEQRQKELENEKKEIVVVKEKLDIVVGEAKSYQAKLSSQIAKLSARQQEILSQRLASLNIPRSASTGMSGCVDDRDKDPGFSPRFAFFTYGVPNRTGLNQYGANGRAKAGQNAETILNAYYQNFELKKDYSADININVEGYGGYNIEEYVKRIYEMPESWEMEALKAQAIAARSYALSYTNNGAGSICTTQSCQVFKPDPKGGRWEQAVNETKGWVMVQGGNPVKAWYSSTHGGYVFSTGEIGWSDTSWTKHATDTTNGSAGGFSELTSNAYDKDSPWFYCDWGSRSQYNKTAWLKSSEIADIANIILLAKKDGSTSEHLYQTDKPNPAGTDTWNEDKVKQELSGRGITPYTNVSSVSISADFGAGRTTTVNISGDGGSTSISGSEFKDWFNLRASANIQIVGPLYNIEQR
ncbi:MAG: Stage II sporulation protein D [Candidatus Levybacteria bacterium GW2011_GWB1_35_5]|nr:MAG: Stage II sporulation protein D [Candidatus Levybacteria bacterium GW2011_GWB1_35_5]